MQRPDGANRRMSGKIKPNGIEEGGEQFGTTIERSSPARFRNTGASQKKKGSGGDTIKCGPEGTTFTAPPSFPAPLPAADVRPKGSKTVGSADEQERIGDNETAGRQTASQKSGDGGPTQRQYPLARGYEKKGRTDRKSNRLKV